MNWAPRSPVLSHTGSGAGVGVGVRVGVGVGLGAGVAVGVAVGVGAGVGVAVSAGVGVGSSPPQAVRANAITTGRRNVRLMRFIMRLQWLRIQR